jgi:hypothetical protein
MFLIVTQTVGSFVYIAVIPNLMPIFYNGINRFGMIFNAPGWDEKALLQSKSSIGIQNPWNGNFGTITQ